MTYTADALDPSTAAIIEVGRLRGDATSHTKALTAFANEVSDLKAELRQAEKQRDALRAVADAAEEWRRHYGNTSEAFGNACTNLVAAMDALPNMQEPCDVCSSTAGGCPDCHAPEGETLLAYAHEHARMAAVVEAAQLLVAAWGLPCDDPAVDVDVAITEAGMRLAATVRTAEQPRLDPVALAGLIRQAVSDPGSVLPRRLDADRSPDETVGSWASRAVLHVLTNGTVAA